VCLASRIALFDDAITARAEQVPTLFPTYTGGSSSRSLTPVGYRCPFKGPGLTWAPFGHRTEQPGITKLLQRPVRFLQRPARCD
jgi:hypothetical protein